jgi:hypothetical protein
MKKIIIKSTALCLIAVGVFGCGSDCTNYHQNSAYNSGYESGKEGAVEIYTSMQYWEAAVNADGNHTDLIKEKSSYKDGYNDGKNGKKCKCEGVKPSHW